MATPLLQKARQRKMIYFGAIVVLFTASLIHRQMFLEPQAYRLQLREESRGEVELVGSAVRLMTTGSRGLAVTFLWYTAMDKQKRGEYHELELLVKSITTLQPYFITPWLYQSWNISFNVAVECDRPRDKYYYISRGLELLAEGERRNRGAGKEGGAADPGRIAFPGNPELRHFMGFFYQLKIGTSDERQTMRCLIEMSCIDPLERNPADFWTQVPGRRVVDMKKFRAFCEKYPRLVRRLRESPLKYETPDRIVKFLDDHKDIPSRFEPIDAKRRVAMSKLKSMAKQFPILPPREGADWPDPGNPELTAKESVDVYLLCRTWYEYAQKPLPPPQRDGRPQTQDYDKVKYRLPRHMVTQLFRQYPARAQIYIAETLEAEGFFDNDGWEIKDWFGDDAPHVGYERKYFSGDAWDKGYKMYLGYGIENGIYLTPTETKEFNEEAADARKMLNLKPEQAPPANVRAEFREGQLAKSLAAHTTLFYSEFFRRLGNFNAFLYQAEAERDPVTVAARKMLFIAEQRRKTDPASELLLAYYDKAWPLYIHACLKYPRFAQVSSMQEDLYEIHQQYLGLTQKVHAEEFKAKAILAAKFGFCPYPLEFLVRYAAISQKEADEQQMSRVVPIKHRLGPLDTVEYYDGPDAKVLKEKLFLWLQGASMAQNNSVAAAVTYPGQEFFLLSRAVAFDRTKESGPVTAATSSRPIVITSKDHGLSTGMEVSIAGVPKAASRRWQITVIDANTFSLNDSNGADSPAIDKGAFWTTNWQPLIVKDTRRITANRLGLDR